MPTVLGAANVLEQYLRITDKEQINDNMIIWLIENKIPINET